MSRRQILDPDRLLRDFAVHLKLDRGQSENTAEAYLDDVGKLTSYLSAEKIRLADATADP